MNKNKFRAWDKVNRKFVPPSYVAVNGDGVLLITDSGMLEKLQNRNYCVVDREYSIHQFIGILDRNMREIYEGDVVRYKFELHEHEWEESFGEVYFHDGCFMFDRSYQFCAIDVNFRLESLEVIGNMYEDYMYDETGKLIKQFKS